MVTTTTKDALYFNGINARTGQYILAPSTLGDLAKRVVAEKSSAEADDRFSKFARKLNLHFGLDPSIRPEDGVAAAGWGLIVLEDEKPQIEAALDSLIQHRKKHASTFKVLTYRRGQAWRDWLIEQGVAPGEIDTEKVPYYLLIAGSPEDIPFEFSVLLDVEYAVGRLHYDDRAHYSKYADNVVKYETENGLTNKKEVAYFGTRHDFDPATNLSSDQLLNPLIQGRANKKSSASRYNYQSTSILSDAATKDALRSLFCKGTGNTPALLFSATHGMGFPTDDPDQYSTQGALLCADWPGFGNVSQSDYFAASDLPSDTDLNGMITFHFACYGGGTPLTDRFCFDNGPPPQIAPRPFLAALPRKATTLGALASIAHVERAWGCSFSTPGIGSTIGVFENAIARILLGHPIGLAVKEFNDKYATSGASLLNLIEKTKANVPVSESELVMNWIERNDSEGYALIGDPAVHLRPERLQ